MNKKYIFLVICSYIFVLFIGFSIGKSDSIPIRSIKGWETWENNFEVGLEIQTDSGDFSITKEPYTAKCVKVEKIEY